MEMQTLCRDDSVHVSVAGEIKGVDIIVLCRRIEALADEGCTRLSVDLSAVTAIDSHGVGGLTYTDILFRKKGIAFVLLIPRDSAVHAVFKQVNLDRVLTIEEPGA